MSELKAYKAPALLVGSCNACNDSVSSTVIVIQFGSLYARVCPQCAALLKLALIDMKLPAIEKYEHT